MSIQILTKSNKKSINSLKNRARKVDKSKIFLYNRTVNLFAAGILQKRTRRKKWKELINQKSVKEAKCMASVKEWKPKAEEMFCKEEETEEEKEFLPKDFSWITDWKKTANSILFTKRVKGCIRKTSLFLQLKASLKTIKLAFQSAKNLEKQTKEIFWNAAFGKLSEKLTCQIISTLSWWQKRTPAHSIFCNWKSRSKQFLESLIENTAN